MKLYELPRQSYFSIDEDNDHTVYFFDHIDGMYSYCKTLDTDEVFHLTAWTEVTPVFPVKTYADGQPNYTPRYA
jgi:hypothetical protein